MDALQVLAREAGCTAAQVSLAWLLAKGDDIIPIPGTTSLAHLREDIGAAHVVLSADLMQRQDALINPSTVRGARYNATMQPEIDTEEF